MFPILDVVAREPVPLFGEDGLSALPPPIDEVVFLIAISLANSVSGVRIIADINRLKQESVAVLLVFLAPRYERGDLLFREVVLFVNLVLEVISQPLRQGYWFRKLICIVSEPTHHEAPFPVLRHTVVLCVQNLIRGLITHTAKRFSPHIEIGLVLLGDDLFHVFHDEDLREIAAALAE